VAIVKQEEEEEDEEEVFETVTRSTHCGGTSHFA
jgi:hypothetical protein